MACQGRDIHIGDHFTQRGNDSRNFIAIAVYLFKSRAEVEGHPQLTLQILAQANREFLAVTMLVLLCIQSSNKLVFDGSKCRFDFYATFG